MLETILKLLIIIYCDINRHSRVKILCNLNSIQESHSTLKRNCKLSKVSGRGWCEGNICLGKR